VNNEQVHNRLIGYGNYTTLYHTTEKLTGVLDTDVKGTCTITAVELSIRIMASP